MRIYISADMEGVAGIFLPEQLKRGTPEYAEARRWLTAEVNACIEGAFKGGATEVIVKDAHSSGFNFVLDEIDPRVEVVQGGSLSRFPGLDSSFSGLILLCYHAMAGTQEAICDHTMSSVDWHRYELNGMELGEVGIDAAEAGALGVPVIMVSGDDKVCAETKQLLGDETMTCQVKIGLARHYVRTRPPAAARYLIRNAAEEAVRNSGRMKPFKPEPPYLVRLEYNLTSGADRIRCDGVRTVREGPRTIVFKGDDLLEVITRSL